MAVQSDTSRISYAGNNSTTTSYAVPFVFQENSHLKAIARTAAGVESAVTLTNHTGAGDPNGGTVRTSVAVPATSTLTIFRDVPITQTTIYQEGGDFPAASHERALDKLTQIAQQTQRQLGSAIRLSEATQLNPLVPPASATPHVLTTVNGNAPTWETAQTVSLDIPALTDATTVGPSDELIVQQSGFPKRATANELLNGTATVTATGSTAGRTLQDRFADVVNVKDFGAVGDGIADDTAAINAAIAALPFFGGTVYFPRGRYRTTATITVTQRDLALVGAGSGGIIASLNTWTQNNVPTGAQRGATILVADFIGGPVIRVKERGFSCKDMTVDATSDAGIGGFAPVSLGAGGRKGLGSSSVDHGIYIEADDTAGAVTNKFYIHKVAITNQPADGILVVNGSVSSRIDLTTVQHCGRHAISLQSGDYTNRANQVRLGQIQLNNVSVSRNGGHGLNAGETNSIPYRIELINYECFWNLITPAHAVDQTFKANIYFRVENSVVMESAVDGATYFSNVNNAAYIPLFVAGRNNEFINLRCINSNPYAVYVAQHPTATTAGIDFTGFYVATTGSDGVTPLTTSPVPYNPAIFMASGVRGVTATTHLPSSQITTLTNKLANSFYSDSYSGILNTNITHNFAKATVDILKSDTYRSTTDPTEIALADDQACYIQFSAAARGVCIISSNTSTAQSGVIQFRCGDAFTHATNIAKTADLNVATGQLAGTTGTDAKVTFSADSATNRVYLENRIGAIRAFTFTFIGVNDNILITTNAIVP